MSARDDFRPASSDGMCNEAVWGPMCDEIDRLRRLLSRECADHIQTIHRQEMAEGWADLLASNAGGPDVIGEHSNLNNPWARAHRILGGIHPQVSDG